MPRVDDDDRPALRRSWRRRPVAWTGRELDRQARLAPSPTAADPSSADAAPLLAGPECNAQRDDCEERRAPARVVRLVSEKIHEPHPSR